MVFPLPQLQAAASPPPPPPHVGAFVSFDIDAAPGQRRGPAVGRSGGLDGVEWRREGRSRARHAAHFPSVMKVEQLIITECSLLS